MHFKVLVALTSHELPPPPPQSDDEGGVVAAIDQRLCFPPPHLMAWRSKRKQLTKPHRTNAHTHTKEKTAAGHTPAQHCMECHRQMMPAPMNQRIKAGHKLLQPRGLRSVALCTRFLKLTAGLQRHAPQH